jgi:uncharacterized hydrophobic protein (TIGR00271 family)
MQDNTNQDSRQLKQQISETIKNLYFFTRKVLRVDGTDYEGTVETIKKDIEFKGHNAWILICSIFIASIGLDVNSIPAIIGAMLISPLMGPILGVGLSVGIYDKQLLIKSLKNLAVAVIISLSVSALYFLVTPLGQAQSELLARTKPTILDLLVALFGGFAGIIAGSRKEKTSVIPGVAIATALMPPLCTAGYGLASGNISFFLGAFYLFMINSVFISLSTLLFVRYMKFPTISFIDIQKEQKVKRYITAFIIVVALPSTIIFKNVVEESVFRARAEKFISENVKFEGTEVINQKVIYTDTLAAIELFFIGEPVSEQRINELRSKLPFYGLQGSFIVDDTQIKIHQAKDNTAQLAGQLSQQVKAGILEEIYRKNAEEIKSKDDKIAFLEKELLELTKGTIPFSNIEKEIKVQYPEINTISYGKMLVTSANVAIADTVHTFIVSWNKESVPADTDRKIENWLKVRTEFQKIRVIRIR